MASTVTTRILILSDTHCAHPAAHSTPPFQTPLPAADLAIHCGDLTYTGEQTEYHQALDMLKEIDAPVKLVIAGNHDLTLDREFVSSHPEPGGGASGSWRGTQSKEEAEALVGRARELFLNDQGRAKREDVTFLEEGTHQIDLPNGARVTVYASPYTPEFCDWAYAYGKNEDRFNPANTLTDARNIALQPLPDDTRIDICITHGPPYGRMDGVGAGMHVGCPHLLRAVMRARPLIHCFGHIHEGWGAERVEWTGSADEVSTAPASVDEWRGGGWQAGVGRVEGIKADLDAARAQHGVFVDLSKTGEQHLERGVASFLVNASIMNVMYRPVNAPWVIDVDLPKG